MTTSFLRLGALSGVLWVALPLSAQSKTTPAAAAATPVPTGTQTVSSTPATTSSDSGSSPVAAPSSASAGDDDKFKARRVGDSLIYLPETVDSKRLERLRNQTIEVRGIISSFAGTKQRYRFSTDDGASIFVIGDFPPQGGVTYYLRGRVVQDAGALALAEIAKQTEPFGTSAKKSGLLDGSNAPLIIGGGVLLLAALGCLGAMSAKNKNVARERALQEQIEAERARTAEAERLRAQSAAASGKSGPGGTVVAQGNGGNVKGARVHQSTVASRGTVRVESGPHAGETFPLVDGETRIGRLAEDKCMVVLPKDAAVSSYHASVFVARDGRLVFEDRSSNGSMVDGAFIQRAQRDITSGTKIQIGASTLGVELFAPPISVAPDSGGKAASGLAPDIASAGVPAGNDKRDAPTVQVESAAVKEALASGITSGAGGAAPTSLGYGAEFQVLSGPEQGRSFPITRDTTTIGREGRDILLSESSVSRQHASLVARGGRFFLQDNGSAHGTRINGESLAGQERELRNGDEATFGAKTTMRFVCLG